MAQAPSSAAGRIARNTAIFSILTGLSRIAGLVREVVASSYFGTSGPFSAFTFAFQVPNLVRSLFADAALSAAFVPVFTELLEKGREREAFQLASTFVVLIVAALTAICVFFVARRAGAHARADAGDEFTPELDELTVGLVAGAVPDRPAARPQRAVRRDPQRLRPLHDPGARAAGVERRDHRRCSSCSSRTSTGPNEMYAYAIGVLAGTVVQLAMCLPVLRKLGFDFEMKVDLRDERVRQVLALMLPVTLSLGLINFNLFINSALGATVSEAVAARDRRRVPPLHAAAGHVQRRGRDRPVPGARRLATRRDFDGLRALTGTGTRQIFLLLIPAAACTLVLAEPITRLVYERGEFGAGLDRARRRGAVLVLLQPAVRRRRTCC